MKEKKKRIHQVIHRPAGFASDYEKAEQATKLDHAYVEAADLVGDTEKVRRFRRAGGPGTIVRKPHVDALLSSGYVAVWEELKRLQEKSTGEGLDEDEIRRLGKLVDSFAKLHKVEIDQSKQETYDELSNEELLALADKAKKVLEE